MQRMQEGDEVRVYLDQVGNRTISLVHRGIDVTSITIPMGQETPLRIDLNALYEDDIPPYIHRMGLAESMVMLRGRTPVAVFSKEEIEDGAEYPWLEADEEEAEDAEG